MDTFQLVTGPKTDHLPTGRKGDHWLVNTVAVLVIAVGLALLSAARRRPSSEMVVLAEGSSIGLMAIDVFYVVRQVIPPIYLVDAGLQAVLLAGWVWVAWRLPNGDLPANSVDSRNRQAHSIFQGRIHSFGKQLLAVCHQGKATN
jgi:hypothetical protein